MSTLELKAYEIFKNKLGEKEAEIVIEYFEAKAEEKYQQKKDVLATKEDLANVKADMIKWFFAFFMALALMILGLYFKK